MTVASQPSMRTLRSLLLRPTPPSVRSQSQRPAVITCWSVPSPNPTRWIQTTSQSHEEARYDPKHPSVTAAPWTVHDNNNNKQDDKEDRTTSTKSDSPLSITTKSSLSDPLGIQSLIPEWKKMFSSDTVWTDVSAGLTVGCVAIPLSLAIAVASGVPPEVGLVTAAVSGVAGGLFGGTTLAITGPAAAISLLVFGAVQQHGLVALPLITLLTGGLQMASGYGKIGVYAKLVPVSVIAGFTTGVGTMILSGQLPKALGLMDVPSGLNPLEMMSFVGQNLSLVHPSAAALALGTTAALYALPKLHPQLPSALIAVGGATLATHTLGLDVNLIGDIPSGWSAFAMQLPSMPTLEAVPSLAATSLLIYSMTSVESLLSCAALEKMKPTSYPHNPNQELIGQGMANVSAGLVGGMPVTSVIARSGLNLQCQAQTRLPSLIQSGFVLGSVVWFGSGIALIPMPALSGMLIATGMNMLLPHELKHCTAVQKSDLIPFATTVAGMLSLGLAEGIGMGCLSALALNYNAVASSNPSTSTSRTTRGGGSTLLPSRLQAMETTGTLPSVAALEYYHEYHGMAPALHHGRGVHSTSRMSTSNRDASNTLEQDPATWTITTSNNKARLEQQHPARRQAANVKVWKLTGPINFVSMLEIDELIHQIRKQQSQQTSTTFVLDMEDVTSLEFTGMEELINRLSGLETPVQMIHCSPNLLNAMDHCDPTHTIVRM